MPQNYFNPATTRPTTTIPGLDGMMMMRDRQIYDQMMHTQQGMQTDALRRQQMETSTYEQDEPMRGAERTNKIGKFGLDTMLDSARTKNPDYVPSQVGGEIGKNQTAAAQGRFDTETVGGKIDKQKMDNIITGMEQQGRQLQLKFAQNPMMADAEYRQFIQQMPENLRGAFPRQYNHQQVGIAIQRFNDAIRNSPEYQRKIGEIEATGKWHKEVAGIQAKGQVDAAGARSKNKEVSYKDQLMKSKGDPAQALRIAQMIEDDPETSPELKKIAGNSAKIAFIDWTTKYAIKLPPEFKGMPPMPAAKYMELMQQIVMGKGGIRPDQSVPGSNPQQGNSGVTKFDAQGNVIR
jgi:hypothetical protein